MPMITRPATRAEMVAEIDRRRTAYTPRPKVRFRHAAVEYYAAGAVRHRSVACSGAVIENGHVYGRLHGRLEELAATHVTLTETGRTFVTEWRASYLS